MKVLNYFTFIFFICCIIFGYKGFTQKNTELKAAKKLYEGEWVNKKAKRHLTISFDTDDHATINDWHGKWSQENNTIEAYKAFLKQGKLVMPEDKTDLRSPYCEIIKKGNLLLYRCREINTKNTKFVDNIWFVRAKN